MGPTAANLGLVLAGFVLLIGAAEFLVRGAVGLAKASGVSSLLIGLTVVAFGTSAPELASGLSAVYRGAPDLNLGNVVGSNIANIGLILGATAMLAPVRCTLQAVQREVPIMIVVTIVTILLAMTGASIARWEAGLLLVGLAAYIGFGYIASRRESAAEKARDKAVEHELEAEFDVSEHPSVPKCIVLVVVGLAGLTLGANLLVAGAQELGKMYGVPEFLLGLFVLAIGTSLPELATSVVAAIRRQPDIVIGNVLGSNVFNLLGVLGVTGLVSPLPTPALAASRDLWVMLVFALICFPIMRTGYVIKRWEGAVFILLYFPYAIFCITS